MIITSVASFQFSIERGKDFDQPEWVKSTVMKEILPPI